MVISFIQKYEYIFRIVNKTSIIFIIIFIIFMFYEFRLKKPELKTVIMTAVSFLSGVILLFISSLMSNWLPSLIAAFAIIAVFAGVSFLYAYTSGKYCKEDNKIIRSAAFLALPFIIGVLESFLTNALVSIPNTVIFNLQNFIETNGIMHSLQIFSENITYSFTDVFTIVVNLFLSLVGKFFDISIETVSVANGLCATISIFIIITAVSIMQKRVFEK